MTSSFEFELRPTFRDLQGRFARASRQLLEDRRDLMRSLGRRFVALAGEEAPGGPGHTVARQVGYRTFVEADALGFRATLGQVARWHATGTGIYGPRRAPIRPRRARALRFTIGGRTVFARSVRGVRPNPYLGRAYRRFLPGARADLRRIATRYSRTLASGTKGGTL